MKLKSYFPFFAFVLGLFFITSCASIISGSKQEISFSSKPTAAIVTIQPGDQKITTPGKIELERKNGPYRVTFNYEGYEPYSVTLTTSTNGWIWGNLILGGIIGMLIDGSTGASIELSPEELHANLIKAGVEPPLSKIDMLYLFSEEKELLVQMVLK